MWRGLNAVAKISKRGMGSVVKLGRVGISQSERGDSQFERPVVVIGAVIDSAEVLQTDAKVEALLGDGVEKAKADRGRGRAHHAAEQALSIAGLGENDALALQVDDK